MRIALKGYAEDDEDREDPIWLVPPWQDLPVLSESLTKARSEDLQILSWLYSTSVAGFLNHPVEVLQGEDPPDRLLRARDETWGLELTQLTVEDVRQDLSPIRRFGRDVLDNLKKSPESYQHLSGRQVFISALEGADSIPKASDGLRAAVLEALREDRGVVGEDVYLEGGRLPDKWPETRRGFYGGIGPLIVQVNPGKPETDVSVICTTQASIRLSEAMRELCNRVDEKDSAGNSILLITCGLPDVRGYVCELDHWIFRHIADSVHRMSLTSPPSHIDAVLLHLWGSCESLLIYEREDASLPW